MGYWILNVGCMPQPPGSILDSHRRVVLPWTVQQTSFIPLKGNIIVDGPEYGIGHRKETASFQFSFGRGNAPFVMIYTCIYALKNTLHLSEFETQGPQSESAKHNHRRTGEEKSKS